MGWIRQGDVMADSGHYSEYQEGKAASVRFVNSDLPGRVVTVVAYAHAPQNDDGEPDLSGLGIEAWHEFVVCRDIEDPGGTEEWADDRYEFLDTRPYNGDKDAAERDALAWIRSYDPAKFLHWDGGYDLSGY